MASKQKRSTGKLLMSLLLLVPNIINLALKTTALVKMEARLAGKNLALLVLLSVLFSCIMITSWICLLILLALYLLQLQFTLPAAMLIVLLINLLFLVVVGVKMKHVKEEFTFEQLAHHLRKPDLP